MLIPHDEVEARLRPVRRSKRQRNGEQPAATATAKKAKIMSEIKALSVVKNKTKSKKTIPATTTTVATSIAAAESVENSDEKPSSASSSLPSPTTNSDCAELATDADPDPQPSTPKPASPATKPSADTALATSDLQASGLVCTIKLDLMVLLNGVLVSYVAGDLRR